MACQKWHNREHTTSWSEMGNRWDGRPWDHLCLLACHMMVARTQLIWCHNQHSVSCLGCTLIGCCLFNSHYLPTCFTVYLLLAFVQLFLSSMAFMMITTHKKKTGQLSHLGLNLRLPLQHMFTATLPWNTWNVSTEIITFSCAQVH